MRIIVKRAKGGWTWAFVAKNGKQTANNEVFATRYNAKRAAKAVVGAILRGYVPRPAVVWDEEGDVLTFGNRGVQ